MGVFKNVTTETARGSGEHLTAMLDLYGCQASAHTAIVGALRPAVAAQVRDPAYTTLSLVEKSERYFQLVDSAVNTRFAQACSA